MARNNAWSWGACLGALVIIFVGAFFLVREATDGGGDACDSDLPRLGSSSVSAEAFVREDAALKRVVDMLNAGDRTGAEAAFFGPVHNFTHNVHPLLREQDLVAARDLCQWVIRLENGFSVNASDASVAVRVDHIRGLLRDAAVALGYPRP